MEHGWFWGLVPLQKKEYRELLDKAEKLEAVKDFVLIRRDDIENDMENFGTLKPVLSYFLEEAECREWSVVKIEQTDNGYVVTLPHRRKDEVGVFHSRNYVPFFSTFEEVIAYLRVCFDVKKEEADG